MNNDALDALESAWQALDVAAFRAESSAKTVLEVCAPAQDAFHNVQRALVAAWANPDRDFHALLDDLRREPDGQLTEALLKDTWAATTRSAANETRTELKSAYEEWKAACTAASAHRDERSDLFVEPDSFAGAREALALDNAALKALQAVRDDVTLAAHRLEALAAERQASDGQHGETPDGDPAASFGVKTPDVPMLVPELQNPNKPRELTPDEFDKLPPPTPRHDPADEEPVKDPAKVAPADAPRDRIVEGDVKNGHVSHRVSDDGEILETVYRPDTNGRAKPTTPASSIDLNTGETIEPPKSTAAPAVLPPVFAKPAAVVPMPRPARGPAVALPMPLIASGVAVAVVVAGLWVGHRHAATKVADAPIAAVPAPAAPVPAPVAKPLVRPALVPHHAPAVKPAAPIVTAPATQSVPHVIAKPAPTVAPTPVVKPHHVTPAHNNANEDAALQKANNLVDAYFAKPHH